MVSYSNEVGGWRWLWGREGGVKLESTHCTLSLDPNPFGREHQEVSRLVMCSHAELAFMTDPPTFSAVATNLSLGIPDEGDFFFFFVENVFFSLLLFEDA